MSGYTRNPISAVAHCTEPGCKFVRIFWQQESHRPASLRAAASLHAHMQMKHPETLRMRKAMVTA